MSANYKCDGCGKIVNCEHVEIIDGKGLCRGCSSKHWTQKFTKDSSEKASKTATDDIHAYSYELHKDSKSVDIHKIIDDAMEKKDRSVTIFIGKEATTVSVYPYEDKPREWVPHKNSQGMVDCYVCPECGHFLIDPLNYCPACGEKLKMPIVVY